MTHSHGHAWSVGIDGTEHFAFTDHAAYYLALPLRLLLRAWEAGLPDGSSAGRSGTTPSG
ncbi:MAG: hypothetical protein ACTHOK_11335 [Nocardioidaceae bacterium]